MTKLQRLALMGFIGNGFLLIWKVIDPTGWLFPGWVTFISLLICAGLFVFSKGKEANG